MYNLKKVAIITLLTKRTADGKNLKLKIQIVVKNAEKWNSCAK